MVNSVISEMAHFIDTILDDIRERGNFNST